MGAISLINREMGKFKFVFLGTGTSQGVPVIACKCDVCTSSDLRDKRLRTSVMLSFDDQNVVIDTGPDFRQQMLREDVETLEAVVFTHEHKDHISGMDDIRAFNFSANKPVDIYASELTEIGLRKEFHYVFGSANYPGIPQVQLHRVSDEPFQVVNETFIPINVMHYKLPVKAFRVRNFTYITDANSISPTELEKVMGSEYLVINALRKSSHISHFSLDEALAIIALVKPKRAFLTHISHLMGKHEETSRILPEGVEIAYDGLTVILDEN